MVHIPSRRFPRAATSRSRGGRVDSRLAISRISCSRLPFLQPACTCHRSPQTTRGPCVSRHFSCLPTCQETTFSAEEFCTLLLVRLHLLHIDARFCKCGELLDVYGHHRSPCSRIGLCRCHDDQRRIEVIANGLPFWGGKQVAIDTTVVSALTGRGVARGRRQGQAIHQTEQDKRRRYPELLTGTRCLSS